MGHGGAEAQFANALMRFIADDYPRSKFHKDFYRRLSNTFGHIAHYDSARFYEHFFLTAKDKLEFLEQCAEWACFGDPADTYSDVERAVGARLRKSQIVTIRRCPAPEGRDPGLGAAEPGRHDRVALSVDPRNGVSEVYFNPPAPRCEGVEDWRQRRCFGR